MSTAITHLNQSYGMPIPEKLSDFLKAYTTVTDRADVCAVTQIGTSTLRDVVNRYNNLTEKNECGVLALIETAVSNAQKQITDAQEAIEFFNNLKTGNHERV